MNLLGGAAMVLVMWAAGASPQGSEEKPVKFRVLPWTCAEVARPSAKTITSDVEWKKFLGEIVAEPGGAPRVDFRRQTVAVIHAGERPTGGYSVRVEKVASGPRAGQARVWRRVLEPGPDAMVTQALTYPCAVLVLEGKFTAVEISSPSTPLRRSSSTSRAAP